VREAVIQKQVEMDDVDLQRGMQKRRVVLDCFYLANVGPDLCWSMVRGTCKFGANGTCKWVHVPPCVYTVTLESQGRPPARPSGERGGRSRGANSGGRNGTAETTGPPRQNAGRGRGRA